MPSLGFQGLGDAFLLVLLPRLGFSNLTSCMSSEFGVVRARTGCHEKPRHPTMPFCRFVSGGSFKKDNHFQKPLPFPTNKGASTLKLSLKNTINSFLWQCPLLLLWMVAKSGKRTFLKPWLTPRFLEFTLGESNQTPGCDQVRFARRRHTLQAGYPR